MAKNIGIIVILEASTPAEARRAALASIRAQSLADRRLEVVLAGPVDASGIRSRGVRHVRTPTDREGAILNAALARTEAELLAITDDTTVLRPQKLARQVQALQSGDQAEVCVHPVEGGGPADLARRWTTFGPLATLFMSRPWMPGALLLRRDALEKLEGFREIPLAEWEMAIRLLLAGRRFVVLPEALAQRHPPAPAEVPVLSPVGGRHPFIKEHLEDIGVKDLFQHTVLKSVSDGYAFKAGLYDLHDYLDEAQAVIARARVIGESRCGLYWKAIVQRRRGEYADSRQTFRALGAHAIFEDLYARADAALAAAADVPTAGAFRARLAAGGTWDPTAFVDWCEELQRGPKIPPALRAAERIQQAEAQLLLTATFRAAVKEEA